MKLSPKFFLAVAITAIASFWVWLAISDVRNNAFPVSSAPTDEQPVSAHPTPHLQNAEAGTSNSSHSARFSSISQNGER